MRSPPARWIFDRRGRATGGDNGDGSPGSATGGRSQSGPRRAARSTTGAITANLNAFGGDALINLYARRERDRVEISNSRPAADRITSTECRRRRRTEPAAMPAAPKATRRNRHRRKRSRSTARKSGGVTINGATDLTANGKAGMAPIGGMGQGGKAGIIAVRRTHRPQWRGHSVRRRPRAGMRPAAPTSAARTATGTGGNGFGGLTYIEADSVTGGREHLQHWKDHRTTATFSGNANGGTGGAGNGDNIVAGTGGSATGGQYTGFDTAGAYALADINGAALTLTDVTVQLVGRPAALAALASAARSGAMAALRSAALPRRGPATAGESPIPPPARPISATSPPMRARPAALAARAMVRATAARAPAARRCSGRRARPARTMSR